MRILSALAFAALVACGPMPSSPDGGRSDARADAAAHPLVGAWVTSGLLRSNDDAGAINGTISTRLVFSADGTFASAVVIDIEGCTRASETGRGTWRAMGDDVLVFSDYVCSTVENACPRFVELSRCTGHSSARIGAADVRWGVRGSTLTFYDRGLNRVEYTRE